MPAARLRPRLPRRGVGGGRDFLLLLGALATLVVQHRRQARHVAERSAVQLDQTQDAGALQLDHAHVVRPANFWSSTTQKPLR